MMKTKYTPFYLLLASALLLSTVSTQAQIKHVDPSPDLNLLGAANTHTTAGKELNVDIDQDGSADFFISYWNYQNMGIWNVNFNQLDTNNRKIEFVFDKNVPPSAIGPNYVKMINEGLSIDPSEVSWEQDYAVIADVYNGNLLDRGPSYIGFRLILGSNKYQYGWLKLDLATSNGDFDISITEYAFEQTENQGITAGQKTGSSVGINSLSAVNTGLNIFPNPSQGEVMIQLPEWTEPAVLEVYTLAGEKTFTTSLEQNQQTVDLAGLESGMYVLRVSSSQQVYQGRILIQH